MKIRNGFVSNSSSSSFIIEYKKNVCEYCGRSNYILFDVLKNVTNLFSDSTIILAEGKEEILQYLKENYEWMEGDELNDLVNKINNINHDNLIFLNISYHDVYFNNFFNNEISKGNFIVLFGTEN